MNEKFYALLTHQGAAKLANATALGTQLKITQMAVGDGGGSLPTPDASQTQLIGERRRAALNSLSLDPINTHQLIAEQVIPETEGGWWIREIGLFDSDDTLIALANCPETYKPQLQQGSGRTQTLRMILIVSSTAAVTLKIDPAVVLATRQYVDDKVIEVKVYADKLLSAHEKSRNHPDASKTEKGFVTLSSATDSDSETAAASMSVGTTANTLMKGDDTGVVRLDNWQKTVKAKDLDGEPRYTTTIDFTGLSTERYYPVWWQNPANAGANSWLTIHRPYHYDGHKNPFGAGVTHLAGLLVQLEGGDCGWGGDAHYLTIKRLHQSYRKTVKAIRFRMLSVVRPVDGNYPLHTGYTAGAVADCPTRSGCYLRGGLTYFVTSNFGGIFSSREEGKVEMSRHTTAGGGKTKTKVEDAVHIGVAFEVRYMAKSFAASDPNLGDDYEDATLPYSLDYDKRYEAKKGS
ncbi:phage tail protein [Candidatus Fukatsuia endosymbiont of Tuberolachnus salignus]|uniref:phage tail protein n=1 Tax=Candidatus Fukatsuia endosymbiont of Tuberolachnus salignus TaxID=3077957 RepID=UPI00313EF4BF